MRSSYGRELDIMDGVNFILRNTMDTEGLEVFAAFLVEVLLPPKT